MFYVVSNRATRIDLEATCYASEAHALEVAHKKHKAFKQHYWVVEVKFGPTTNPNPIEL
jgi:hypothetical protein